MDKYSFYILIYLAVGLLCSGAFVVCSDFYKEFFKPETTHDSNKKTIQSDKKQ